MGPLSVVLQSLINLRDRISALIRVIIIGAGPFATKRVTLEKLPPRLAYLNWKLLIDWTSTKLNLSITQIRFTPCLLYNVAKKITSYY